MLLDCKRNMPLLEPCQRHPSFANKKGRPRFGAANSRICVVDRRSAADLTENLVLGIADGKATRLLTGWEFVECVQEFADISSRRQQ